MKSRIKSLAVETRLLLRSIPSLVVAAYIVAIISMNLLANKLVPLPVDFVVVDCGIFVSWAIFLTMDIVTRHFGPRAATILSVVALFFNLAVALLFYGCGHIPGIWGESYVEGSETVINTALDNTFSGNWFIVFGSSAAFLCSALVNNFLNSFIGKTVEKKKKNFGTFAVRSYASTFIGQFTDNIVFALIVSHTLFGLSLLQCFMCALTGAVVEMLCEVVFSPIGYRVSKNWEKDKVGAEYFAFVEARERDKKADSSSKDMNKISA